MPANRADGTAATARRMDALVTMARERTRGDVSEEAHLAGRARFVAAIEKERGGVATRAIAARASWAIAAAFVIGIGAWGFGKWRAPEWRVDGAVAQGEGFVRTGDDREATIHFADGSDVVLAPKSRARVTPSSKGDAHHVVLEDGRVEVRIARGATLAFAFDAGPFTVRATRGAIAVAWSGSDESLDVAPHDGDATVQGDIAGAGIGVKPGERLTARSRAGELKIVRADGGIATSIAPAPPPSAPIVAPVAPSSSDVPASAPDDDAPPSASSKSASAPRASWSALVARGEYGAVVRDADAMGVDSVLAHKSLGELAALADASRYESRVDLAKRALVAERSRFPSSKEARTAAFLLGRLADDQGHAPADAIHWYDRYLKEAPNGPFAGDALGRKMVAVRATQGADAARPIAEEYARRYPRGTYARVARELTGP